MTEVKLVKSQEVVKKMGISLRTLYRWIDNGRAVTYRAPGKKQHLFDINQIKKIK